MNNLMELINTCDPAKWDGKEQANVEAQVAELRELGFSLVAARLEEEARACAKRKLVAWHNYIEITEDKICKFLKAKAEAYNKKQKPQKGSNVYAEAMQYSQDIQLTRAHDNTTLGLSQIPLLTIQTQAVPTMPTPPTAYGECCFAAPTVHWLSAEKNTIGSFQWKEMRLCDYESTPPQNVLEKLREHKEKNIFDYFTIASVNAVPDPLLLGRINASKCRYFIAQWDDDISLDDVI